MTKYKWGLWLQRYAYMDRYTLGRMKFNDSEQWQFFTIERPWLGNTPTLSCIPEFTYRAEHYIRPAGRGESLILSGGSVTKAPDIPADPENTYNRWGILMHVGNTAQDVQGCIAPGLTFPATGDRVLQSRAAMDQILERTRTGVGIIDITSKRAVT